MSRSRTGSRRAEKPAPGRDLVALMADPDTIDPTGVMALQVGTAAWGVAFLGLLPFWNKLTENGQLWWLWTCSAGVALGLFGIDWCKRRAAQP